MVEKRVAGARIAREVLATLGKAAIALTVFGVIVFSFRNAVLSQAHAMVAAQPLPDETASDECAVWFVGSSSMSRWASLQHDMRPWSTHNRSVSGATLDEINKRFSNDPVQKAPKGIVFYAGENDLAFGASVDKTIAHVADFMRLKASRYGDVPVLFVSLKPSPLRWDEHEKQQQVNDGVRALAQQRRDLFFVNTAPRLLVNGLPGPFYGDDKLHLNEAGYKILTQELQAALRADISSPVVRHCTLVPRRA